MGYEAVSLSGYGRFEGIWFLSFYGQQGAKKF